MKNSISYPLFKPLHTDESETITVLGDRVLVRQDEEVKMLRGLHLPDGVEMSDERYPSQGRVLAVGRDVVDVKPGDRVLFRRRGGTAMNGDGLEAPRESWRNLLVLKCPPVEKRAARVRGQDKGNESDILAVLEP